MPAPSERVVVAMSGGVDSSVAAAILKESSLDVVGIGLRLVGSDEAPGERRSCCGIGAMDDARRVAEKLGIPFYVLNFEEVFRKAVVDYFVSSYLRAETPNPCIPCNEVVKFEELLRAARGLNAPFLATGHYARVTRDRDSGRRILERGTDRSKDQSYFLYSLSQEQLASAVFPLGEMEKKDTRELAACLGLKVHDKEESQDVCFVGAGGYRSFIEEYASGTWRTGPILDDSGAVLGTHGGLHNYTVGQRRGLGLSTREAMYVVDVDPVRNAVIVAPGSRVRGQERLLLERMNYVSIEKPGGPVEVTAVTRYRKPEVPATLLPLDGCRARVEFHAAQEPTAPGQSVVLYRGDEVVGGGVAARVEE